MSSPISAVSQMLERNQALFVGKRLLVCGTLEDDYPRQLAELASSLTVFTTDYCYYRSQQATLGDAILFDHQLGGAPRFDALLLLMPKAKAEAQYLLAMMTPLLEAGADPLATNSGGASFQAYYFSYPPRNALNERALAERREVVAWLKAHQVPLEANVDPDY